MLTDEARDLLEGGCALIIGLTKADGSPFATRGWGFDVEDPADTARVLVRAADLAALGVHVGDAPDVPIAVTAADVRTLASVQLKGRLARVTPSVEGDAERMDRYCDVFIDAIVEVDGIAREVGERWRHTDTVVRAWIRFEELFVQTPGPGAGASVAKVQG
ncbi:MAG: hypothetical protein JWO77_3143 [Ilumatobacteraceae bacterium]|nr:hypothetical protein [Ilumatobacteraceae bacterium]